MSCIYEETFTDKNISEYNYIKDISTLMIGYKSMQITTYVYNKNELSKEKLEWARETYGWKDTITSITVMQGSIEHNFNEKYSVIIILNIVYDRNNLRKISVELFQDEDDMTDYNLILESYYFENIRQSIFSFSNKKRRKYTIRNYKSIINSGTIKGAYLIEGKTERICISPLYKNELQDPLTEYIICFDIELEEINFERARSLAYNKVADYAAFLSVLLDIGFKDISSQFLTFIDKNRESISTNRHRTGFIDDYLKVVIKDNFYGIDTIENVRKGIKLGVNTPILDGYTGVSDFNDPSIMVNIKIGDDNRIEKIFENNRIYKVYKDNVGKFSEFIKEDMGVIDEPLEVPKCIGEYFSKIEDLKESSKYG